MRTKFWVMALAATVLVGCSGGSSEASRADEQAISAQMHATWDRPEAPLDVGPIVVQEDHAIADWTQGAMGGRALLRRVHGAWTTVLCAGDGIREAEMLSQAGMPSSQAGALAAKLAVAEKSVPAERLSRMASFKGVVRMNTGADHAEREAAGHPAPATGHVR